jgi:hypothetical protein
LITLSRDAFGQLTERGAGSGRFSNGERVSWPSKNLINRFCCGQRALASECIEVVDKTPFDRAAEMVVANAVRTLVKRDQCSVSLLLRRVVLFRTLGLAIELRFGLGGIRTNAVWARALPKTSSHLCASTKVASLRRNDVCRAGTVA